MDTLHSENPLKWMFRHDRESESGRHVRELLILSPLDFLVAEGFDLFLKVDMHRTPPCRRVLPEVVVVLMEPLVHVVPIITIILDAVVAELLGNVALVLQTGSDLSDVQLYEMGVQSIDVPQLVLSEVVDVDVVLWVDVVMRQHIGRLIFIDSWSLGIMDSHVILELVGVVFHVEVASDVDLLLCFMQKRHFVLLRDLIPVRRLLQFLIDQLSNLGSDLFRFGMVSRLLSDQVLHVVWVLIVVLPTQFIQLLMVISKLGLALLVVVIMITLVPRLLQPAELAGAECSSSCLASGELA